MEAGDNGTARDDRIRYQRCVWGDLIEGTKEQLQAMGLGIGLAFPGEVGGPRLDLMVRDPRGYQVRISNRVHDGDRYSAYLTFPNWPEMPRGEAWVQIAQGLKRREYLAWDEYLGSAGALADAGLVRDDHLPGKPGMRKLRVTILPDGTVVTGALTARHRESRSPGAIRIERASASTYRVQVMVTEGEEARRRAADQLARDAWVRRVRALPRPGILKPMARSELTSIEAARTNAARDAHFQGMLARIVSGAGRPSA